MHLLPSVRVDWCTSEERVEKAVSIQKIKYFLKED